MKDLDVKLHQLCCALIKEKSLEETRDMLGYALRKAVSSTYNTVELITGESATLNSEYLNNHPSIKALEYDDDGRPESCGTWYVRYDKDYVITKKDVEQLKAIDPLLGSTFAGNGPREYDFLK